CCYEGQAHSIEVPVPDPQVSASWIKAEFERHYQDRFGLTLSKFTVMITAVQTVSTVQRARVFSLDRYLPEVKQQGQPAPVGSRTMTTHAGSAPAPVYRRNHLPAGFTLSGPAII